MKSTGLEKFEHASVDDFTSDKGIKIRGKINPLWRNALKLATKRKIIVEQYPELDKDSVYIFVCNHSFDEDVISLLSTIDRNVYVLNGSTDQTNHNPIFYAVWLNGMIFVNRKNETSRKGAVDKMKRILNSGNSVMLFGEGGYNNSENELITSLFSSPYTLAQDLNVKVVPMISYNDFGTDNIYVRGGEPIDLTKYEMYESLDILRDKMSTMLYEMIFEHSEVVKRKELLSHLKKLIEKESKKHKRTFEELNLPNDPRDYYMEMRKLVYEYQKWYTDVWDEELTYYPGHNVTRPNMAREFIDNVHITKDNAYVLAPVLVQREEDKHYDLKEYLRKNLVLQKK